MRSASGKYSAMSSSVRSRTFFFFKGSFWWLYSSTSSMWRNTSPCSRASLATGKRSSRSSMSSILHPSDEQIPRDVGLSEMAVRSLMPGHMGYCLPERLHPHGYSVMPPISDATLSMSSPSGPSIGTMGASTGGAGVSGTVSDSIVRTARPSMKNLIAGEYGSSRSMWDMTRSWSSSLKSSLW